MLSLKVIEVIISAADKEQAGNMFVVFPRLLNMAVSAAHHTINHPDFRKIMDEESFDLFISGFFFNNFQLGLAAHFKCPSIVLSSIPNVQALNELVGQPSNTEAFPNPISGLKGEMNLWERVTNLITAVVEFIFNIYANYVNNKYYT